MSEETDRIVADLNESRSRLNDTMEELSSKLKPSQLASEAATFVKGQAGKAVKGAVHGVKSKVGTQMQRNPLPLLLIAGGIAWMVIESRKNNSSDYSSAPADNRYQLLQDARWRTVREPGESDEAYQERLHQAETSALNLRQRSGEAIQAFKQRVGETIHAIERAGASARDKLTSSLSGARSFASDSLSKTRDFATSSYGSAKDFATERGRQIGDFADQTRRSAGEFYDGNPLITGALAVAVGAALGSALPLSQSERSTLRRVADTAARTGADLAERGARAVGERTSGNQEAVH